MNRIERLTGILLALQRRRQTGQELAEHFEVSRRTILRDVDALSQMGVPVIALPGANGGYELDSEYWLPPVQFSPAEVELLLLSLSYLVESTGSTFALTRGVAEDKLRAAMPPAALAIADQRLASVRMASSSVDDSLPHLETIRNAIAQASWIDADYRSMQREATRMLLPFELMVRAGNWYLLAISHAEAEKRTYRIDRFRAVRPAQPPPDATSVIAAATSGGGVPYDDPSHPQVRIAFSRRGALEAREDPDFRRNLRAELDGRASVSLRCPPAELPFFARRLLAFGADAVAESPPELRELIRRLLKDMARNYREPQLTGVPPTGST